MNIQKEIDDFADWAFQNIITKPDFKERLTELLEAHHQQKLSEMPSDEMKNIKEKILKEYEKGNIIVATIQGLQGMPLKEFIIQPIEGMLYDLNRDEATILTFINDRKWVNDFAACKVIRALKKQIDLLTNKTESTCPERPVQEPDDLIDYGIKRKRPKRPPSRSRTCY